MNLTGYPRDKERFVRLIGFFKEVLDMCNELNITPVLDGSLAVFAYTANQDMTVADVDLSCSEAEFPRLMSILNERKIGFKLKTWHVLQIWKDDLKVELGSMEYWYNNLPTDYETLRIDEADDYQVRMLSLNGLKEFYRQAMGDRAKKPGDNERNKCEALKAKHAALQSVKR
jgi:bacillopeptidase F (M6 metalloprotease family)